MSDFGDAEPEDAWDPDDPVDELVGNLLRRLALLVVVRELGERAQQRLELIEHDLSHVAARIRDGPVDELIGNLLRRLALLVVGRELGERAQQRLELLEQDLTHVAARIRDGRIGSQH